MFRDCRERNSKSLTFVERAKVRSLACPRVEDKKWSININSGRSTVEAEDTNPHTIFQVMHRIRVLMTAYAFVGACEITESDGKTTGLWCSLDLALNYYMRIELAVRTASSLPSVNEIVALDRKIRTEWLALSRSYPNASMGEVLQQSENIHHSWFAFARQANFKNLSGYGPEKPPGRPKRDRAKAPYQKPPAKAKGQGKGRDKRGDKPATQVCKNWNRDPSTCKSPCSRSFRHVCSTCGKKDHGASTCPGK